MTYTYECEAGVEFTAEQRITESALKSCPLCARCVPKRLISGAPAFNLIPGASGGWANEGYSTPENMRRAEAKLGHKVHRKL